MQDKNKNKGLADNQDGEFILNESGTSVTIDVDVTEDHSNGKTNEEDGATERPDDKE